MLFTLYAARLPTWAIPSLSIVIGVGLGLLLAAFLLARRHHNTVPDEYGIVRRVATLVRRGLVVFRRPQPALAALFFQLLGWTTQLFAVWATMAAFNIDGSAASAALVLVLINLAVSSRSGPGTSGSCRRRSRCR